MEVRAPCIRQLLMLLLLPSARVHHSFAQRGNAAVLHIEPTRLQFSEFESISFACEGFDASVKWVGVRNVEEFIPKCSNSTLTSTVSCTIDFTFESDSGEYWCETEGGERSNTVNITVTAGPVLLESPVHPVTEGDAVTLRCINKATPSNHLADFYKDGLHIWTGYSGKMTIDSVSKSDDGLYKCSISGGGESPESRLTVMQSVEQNDKADPVILESPVLPVTEGDTVTLSCRNRTSSAGLPAVFYKDDVFIGSSSSGNLTIRYVYRTHEGLYRCHISGVGGSAGSRLAVRALHREANICSDHLALLLLLRTVFTVVMVALLLLLVGLLHCGKLRVTAR